MLNVILGMTEDSIHYVSSYFDDVYEESWFRSRLAKDIIKGIDDSEYIDGDYIRSPVFGGMSPTRLSTGCKAVLMLLNEPDTVICGERFGDNCWEWIFKVAEEKDVTITLSHFPPNFGDAPNTKARILNSDKIVTGYWEFVGEMLDLMEE